MRYFKLLVISGYLLTGCVLAQSTETDNPATLEPPKVDPQIKAVIDKIVQEKDRHSAQENPVVVAKPAVDPALQNVIDGIVDDNEETTNKNRAAASGVLDSAQSPSELNSKDIERALAAPDYGKFGSGGEYGDDSAMSEAMAQAETQARTYKETRYGDDVYAYIAVSMSMPAQWFKNMLASLANEHKHKRVVIALQGAKPGEFAKLALAIEQTMPDENEGSYSIVIDPTIFMRLEVTKVPMFAINTEKGWRRVLGEMSLSQATAYALQDYDVFEALGRTYDIEEPNMITLLQERMAEQLENEDPVKAMREQAIGAKPAIVSLPFSEKSYSYLVTPIYTVEQDLIFEGTVFARKGDQVNTLEHLPLKDVYAFIDLSEPSHIAQVRKWKAAHANLRLFSTTLPRAEVLGKYINEFGYISQINQLMVDRFGVEAMPALAYQVGNQLNIDVEKHVYAQTEVAQNASE